MLRFDDPLPRRPRRVLIAGVSGVGKTSFAALIAEALGIPHTEIDSLYHGAGWVPRPEFLGDVRSLAAGESWVTEWQYATARPILAAHADLVVWLDLPFLTVTLPRLVRRTIRRRATREVLWNGNIEAPLHTFFTDREHIVRWAWSTRNTYRVQVPRLEPDYPHLTVVHLQTRRQADSWLRDQLGA